MSPQLKGVLITLAGVLVIVPDSLMIRLIDADAMTKIFWRSSFSCTVLLLWLAFTRNIGRFGKMAFLFAITEASGTILFIVALENTSVASTLFLVSTAPIFSALLSWIFLKETLSKRMIWTILFTLIGVAIIANGENDGNAQRLSGDLAAIGVAISLAVAFTAVRHTPDLPIIPALTVAYAIAATTGALLAPSFTLVGIEWFWIALNGAIFVPLGFALLSIGPRYITSAEVSLILLLEAVLAPLLVWSILGEHPGERVIWGGFIVISVLLISNLLGLKRHPKGS